MSSLDWRVLNIGIYCTQSPEIYVVIRPRNLHFPFTTLYWYLSIFHQSWSGNIGSKDLMLDYNFSRIVIKSYHTFSW